MTRVLAMTAILSLTACSPGSLDEQEGEAPIILGLTTDSVSVGGNIGFIGGNFLTGAKGHTELTFEGEYTTLGGQVHPVDLRFRPHWDDGNSLTWDSVGPFLIPFSPTGDELGTFRGTVTAHNMERDSGLEIDSYPMPASITMEPSIIIREFQPLSASCTAPVKRAIGNFTYGAKIEAIGFTPQSFTYVVAGEPTAATPRIYRKEATGQTDSFGENGEIYFEGVPGDRGFYQAVFAVAALGADGIERATALTIGVHNPIELIPTGRFDVAEIEPARPVSGCIAGGQTNGRTVTYTESETDTRSRQFGITWNETWLEQAQQTNGGSTSSTNGIAVEVNNSSTEGWQNTYTHSFGKEVSASTSVSIIPKIWTVEGGGGFDWNDSTANTSYGSTTSGRSIGRDYSVTDTESWAFTQTSGYNLSQGGQDFWTVSSSSSTIVSFEGFILPGEFGVFYRQATRITLPGVVVAYNMCGIPEVVGETALVDYTWSVDLAQGPECPDFPESELPEAQCYVGPCGSDL